jgi:hypothetical protein
MIGRWLLVVLVGSAVLMLALPIGEAGNVTREFTMSAITTMTWSCARADRTAVGGWHLLRGRGPRIEQSQRGNER